MLHFAFESSPKKRKYSVALNDRAQDKKQLYEGGPLID